MRLAKNKKKAAEPKKNPQKLSITP